MSKPIHQEVTFKATPKRIYDAYTTATQHAEFTGGGATEIDASNGGAFSSHGGVIHGRNIELVPNRLIVQAWRVKNWPEGVYSILKMELVEQGDKTKIVFDQDGVPEDQVPHIDKGWHDRYWEPLQKFLG